MFRKIFMVTMALIFLLMVCMVFGGCSGSGENLKGTWSYVERQSGMRGYFDCIYTYEFSGKNFTWTQRYSFRDGNYYEKKGAFSITDNQIELVYDDGKIDVFPFSRTENTIAINGLQYNRQ
ncbi:MAG: hypothetical protein FWD19_05005 [Defluviitaleaceae bacterium]|nr:hypothetical protein [Defluviitaleaceae bacterium]